MPYSAIYASPLGDMVMWSKEEKRLSALSFYDDKGKMPQESNSEPPIFADVKRWLDIYFSGSAPPFTPPLFFWRGTEFQRLVWEQVMQIPYGKTATYGEIAARLPGRKASHGLCRAVGGALAYSARYAGLFALARCAR